MNRAGLSTFVAIAIGTALAASPSGADIGELRVEIQTPEVGFVASNQLPELDVRGGASVFGGVDALDLFLVLDTSRSLRRTDPKDYRKAGALALVSRLQNQGDIRIGIVDFDSKGELVLPLSSDWTAVKAALRGLDRKGRTDIAAGIELAMQGFDADARPGSSRVMLLFTDGKSDESKARIATARATHRGIAVHTLQLGTSGAGQVMLEEIASSTGGSFLQVSDPSELPEAFLNLRTTGVDSVTLSVNGSAPVPAALAGGSFTGRVPLAAGENRIVATATSLDGRVSQAIVNVTQRGEGCGELEVSATREGQPARSLSRRSVEIVVDASRSMWGRMQGRPKMEVAQSILLDALDWLPPDLELSMRAYGHRTPSERKDCRDSELLVPAGPGSREQIRTAISVLRPRGQTPIGYALEQIAADFGSDPGERAVVLVTDGIESCGGDAVAAARALQNRGRVPVHVIGFGLGSAADEDVASLQAIAEASGGRFLTAGSAEELRDALSVTVGTPFLVWHGAEPVADGILGSQESVSLPAGDYVVRVESSPPREIPVRVASEERLSLVLDRSAGEIHSSQTLAPIEWAACREPADRSSDALTAAPPVSPETGFPASPEATGAPVPAATRSAVVVPATAPGAADSQPRARQWSALEVDQGSVEVWENLRSDRREAWAVVVRHPSYGARPAMVWRGDDRAIAVSVAQGVRDKLMRAAATASPAP